MEGFNSQGKAGLLLDRSCIFHITPCIVILSEPTLSCLFFTLPSPTGSPSTQKISTYGYWKHIPPYGPHPHFVPYNAVSEQPLARTDDFHMVIQERWMGPPSLWKVILQFGMPLYMGHTSTIPNNAVYEQPRQAWWLSHVDTGKRDRGPSLCKYFLKFGMPLYRAHFHYTPHSAVYEQPIGRPDGCHVVVHGRWTCAQLRVKTFWNLVFAYHFWSLEIEDWGCGDCLLYALSVN